MTAVKTPTAPRPFYWSVRRELWENRWVYIAPIVVAAVALVGVLLGLVSPAPDPAAAIDAADRSPTLPSPWGGPIGWPFLAVMVVGWFYCLESLQGERRDRSILFWKSLPVSDLTTVLSKATIPFLVLPVLSFGLVIITLLLMLGLGAIVPLAGSAADMWPRLPPLRLSGLAIYFMAVLTVWHAPFYGWLLLVSAWARRAAFLWAVLPLILIHVVESYTLGTGYFDSLLLHRWMGFFGQAFAFEAGGTAETIRSLPRITPGNLLASPGLWLGLAFTALCLAAAVRLRRHRDPV